jgi:ubiquinone biosynthesis protein Coq4
MSEKNEGLFFYTPPARDLLKLFPQFIRTPNAMLAAQIENALIGLTPAGIKDAFVRRLRKASAALDDRFLAKPYTVDDLAAYPPGSLGHAYRKHMLAFGLAPFDYFFVVEPESDFLYFRTRTYQAHDIIHTLIGFGPDIVGEIGVLGFMAAQSLRVDPVIGSFISSFCAMWFSLYIVNSPAASLQYSRVFAAGWRIGQRAEIVLYEKWEELFDQPVDDLRRRHGLVPFAA